MYVNVTRLFRGEHPRDYSASVAEIGPDAGRATWQAAKELAGELRAARRAFLRTREHVDALRDYARGFGAWEDSQIDAWTPEDCEAWFIQEVCGRMRDACFPPLPSSKEWREFWREEKRRDAAGEESQFGGAIVWKDRRGRVWFYLGR